MRLLALYTPETLKALQEGDAKDREEAKALLEKAERKLNADAAIKDEKKPDPKIDNDGFRIDWRETLRGVRMDMLWDALVDSRKKILPRHQLQEARGGGLEGCSGHYDQGVGESSRCSPIRQAGEFLRVIEDQLETMKAAKEASEMQLLRSVLAHVRSQNRQTVRAARRGAWSELLTAPFAELDPFTG